MAFVREWAALLDRGFGVSRLTAHLLRAIVGLPPNRVDYVPTGIPPAATLASRQPGRPLRLGYAGRLDPDKRPLDLPDLCRVLDARGIDYQLTVAGRGTQSEELCQRAAPWLSNGRFCLREWIPVEKMYSTFYPHLDVALLLSPSEGMPNTLMESMAHEVVPVTSDFRGRSSQGFLRHGETCLVFPVGNMAAAAACIARLASDPALHGQLAKNAREAVERGCGLTAMADSFVRTLELSLEGPQRFGPVPQVLDRSQSRLRRWLGPRAAEFVRRVLRRRFPFHDAGEWPVTYNLRDSIPPGLPQEIERLTREFEEVTPAVGQAS
jgi:glycosyltransferase involved in cell wall biosynthesis